MKVSQSSFGKAKVGVLGNVSASAELAAVSSEHHTTQTWILRNFLKYRSQAMPHGTGHGIELSWMQQAHHDQMALALGMDLPAHGLVEIRPDEGRWETTNQSSLAPDNFTTCDQRLTSALTN